MSDEQFLARWSRRKREERAGQAAPPPEEPNEAQRPAPAAGPAAEPAPPVVDLSSLPPIETIDAATDITAFLRKGIPQELSHAALRRAWSADPAIRDFVGLAENAWDFTDPNAMPGFGPLDYSAEQVEALVRRVVRSAGQLPNPLAETAEDTARAVRAEADLAQASNSVEGDAAPRAEDKSTAGESELGPAAPPPKMAASEEGGESPVRRRTHGGALPQ
jgi:hypothetical protein